ncbi:heat shock protein beta-1-like [Bacillus rossius redtenbacheri]|uniref:heat shock protein beta-1-like n=1 Tax=Bacillus rossius redtenbacheri TaxID=93214 RepID=UPI002FDED6E6
MIGSKLVPVVNILSKALRPANVGACRSVWGYPAVGSLVRDVERQLDKLERDFFRFSPLRRLTPRQIQVQGVDAPASEFRINLDVSGYNPEEISVSLKDRHLSIEAKMERSSEDGSKFFQAVKREFTLPDNIETDSLKSYVNHDGILTIEAPLKQEKPKELPISKN